MSDAEDDWTRCRWLDKHDAATRTAAFLEAARLLGAEPIGIQSTNGIGWIPSDSFAGAARYLRHLARTTGVQS